MRCKQMGINDSDRFYDCMPLYHGTGGLLSTFCMTEGVGLAIGKRFSSSRFWDDVRDSGATAFVYVGETLRYLLANPPGPNDRRHRIRVIFGNGLRPDVWSPFRNRFGIDVSHLCLCTFSMKRTLICSSRSTSFSIAQKVC